ncbi:hypothetical protein AOLI_G00204260 [Acnodon oligacanthus]
MTYRSLFLTLSLHTRRHFYVYGGLKLAGTKASLSLGDSPSPGIPQTERLSLGRGSGYEGCLCGSVNAGKGEKEGGRQLRRSERKLPDLVRLSLYPAALGPALPHVSPTVKANGFLIITRLRPGPAIAHP